MTYKHLRTEITGNNLCNTDKRPFQLLTTSRLIQNTSYRNFMMHLDSSFEECKRCYQKGALLIKIME